MFHSNSNCDQCALCKARSTQKLDSCILPDTTPKSSFYISVLAHKNYRNMKLTVEALNLKNITCLSDNC